MADQEHQAGRNWYNVETQRGVCYQILLGRRCQQFIFGKQSKEFAGLEKDSVFSH